MNNKYCGTAADYQPVSEDHSRVVIMYGLTESEGKAEWYQIEFYKKQVAKPTLQQVKDAIIADIDSRTDERILNGFPWQILHGEQQGETVNVWLSAENQRNFSEAQRVAVMTDGHNLPLTVKVSELPDKTPVYDSFETVEELTEFYLSGVAFIDQCLKDGWQEKDSMDWTPYEQAFQESEPEPEPEPKKTNRKK